MQTLTDEATYNAYMQALAEAHRSINWYKFGDENDIKISGQEGMQGMGLWADEQQPTTIQGATHDNFMAIHTATIIIMTPERAQLQDRKADYQACEQTARDIFSKMILDRHHGLLDTNPNQVKFGEAVHTFSSTKYTCCRMDINWKESADLTFKADRWHSQS